MTLDDICLLIADCPHSTALDEGKGFPLIRTPNIGKGRFILDGVHRVSESVYNNRNKRAIPQDNDIIFAREAPAGNAAIIKNGEKYCLGQRTVLIRPNPEKVYPDYLVYYLLAPAQQYKLLSTAHGATVEHVNIASIHEMNVDNLPSYENQVKAARALSAYDDLIDNNRRQIKLLEEAARRLYWEWFVDFRFPGHEQVPIVDGVPEGWEKKKLTDIADIQYGYAFDGSLFNNEKRGIPILRIRNIPQGTTEDYTTEDAPEQYIVHNGDIVVGMDGEFHINSWCGDDAYLVQRTCRITPKEEDMKGWLLQAIYEPIKYFEKTVVGSTVAHLGKKHLDSINLLIPPKPLQKPLCLVFQKRQLLLNQNKYLCATRDKILPNLINGGNRNENG